MGSPAESHRQEAIKGDHAKGSEREAGETLYPPGDVRCSRPESNRLQVPRGKKDSPQTESTHKMGAHGKKQRGSE